MRLKELRKQRHETLQNVSDAIGVSNGTVANYENEKREPRIDVLIKLADYFDVSVDYLIGHEKTSNHGTGQTFG
ncbi:helix-turn-helix domain-containing protein [Weissella fangxianensis]|uniref:helix-turn-helix domain-containing protein n=1 Tax=Weissella fangxianensis TaxID=2953879 RepID=UPI0021587988|nr:helix-turn-helix transcriptional regulator [Weissella fangxianensis]